MNSIWINILLMLTLLIGICQCNEQCEDPCLECDGQCNFTPGGIKCKCADDMTGDNCDLCLVKPFWYNAGNGYQYTLTDEPSNYRDAQKQCNDQGGHLAIYGIRDPFVYDTIAQKFSDAFVGITDEELEGSFLWNDVVFSSQTWTPWEVSPGNSLDNDCGYLRNSSGSFFLSVVSCSSIAYGLCEIPIGCPPHIPKYNPKNDCEYFIIPPSSRHISHRLCQEHGGNLAISSVVIGDFLKRILHHFNRTGQYNDEYAGVYVGFGKQGSIFTSDFGVDLNVPNSAAEWQPGSPGSILEDCLIAKLNPDWLNYAWLDDMACDMLHPGLCEICGGSVYLGQRTCKSGKVCPANTICIINEGSCFEDCICIEDYVKINETDPSSACIKDKCIEYSCGENSFCKFDPLLNEVGCKCNKAYLPVGKEGEGCFLPCHRAETPACGSNAYCVINPETKIEECVCVEFYMPNPTEIDGCVVDKCATREIICGPHSTCCITDDTTKTQGCICDEGYYFKKNSVTECFDPCKDVQPTCGKFAFCVVDTEPNPPTGHCICFGGYLANSTPCNECVLDLCASGELECGDYATCCITDQTTKTQGCICDQGYYFKENSITDCFDPCATVSCSTAASCIVDTTGTYPVGRCVCNVNFTVNGTVDNGCVADKCADETISCGTNSVCRVTDPLSLNQDCVCLEGYGLEYPGSINCVGCQQTKYTFTSGQTSNYLTTPTFTMPDMSESTLCVWITPNSGQNLVGGLFAYETSSVPNTYLLYFSSATSHILQYLNHQYTFTFEIATKTHFCYVLSKSGGYIKLFANGNFYQQLAMTETSPFPLGGTLIIGQEQDSPGGGFNANQAFGGIAENLMVWTRVLSDSEILAMGRDSCGCSGDFVLALTADVVTTVGTVPAEYPTC